MKKLESFIATGWVYKTYYDTPEMTSPASVNLNYTDTSGLYFPYSASYFKFNDKNTGLEVNTSGLYNMSFNQSDFMFNENSNRIDLSEEIQGILKKAKNMPEYLSPTDSDIYIFVDENYKSDESISGNVGQINIFNKDNTFGKMSFNVDNSNSTYYLSGLHNIETHSELSSVLSNFFTQLEEDGKFQDKIKGYYLSPDESTDEIFYSNEFNGIVENTQLSFPGLFQLAWLIMLNECCTKKLKTCYICNDLFFAIDLCRTFSTTNKLNYNIILMSKIDYFKPDKDGTSFTNITKTNWEIPEAKAGGNTVQIYSCVEFVRRMYSPPESTNLLQTFISNCITQNQNNYFTVKQMKQTALILKDFSSRINLIDSSYLTLYSNISFYGVWFVEAVRPDRVLHYLSSYIVNDEPTLSLLSSKYGYR